MQTNLKLTKQEWSILNDNIECSNARNKVASVLNYLKKHIEKNEGTFSKSLAKIHMFYSRSHFKFTLTHFKNIVNRLKDLGLIVIEKVKNRNVYTLPLPNENLDTHNHAVTKKVTKKVTEINHAQSIDITNVEGNSEKHRYKGYIDNNITLPITYKDILREIKKSYKGIKKVFEVASKKELREIAEMLFVANNVNSDSKRDKYIQYLVLRKIKFSQKQIKFSGAVNYIEAILIEKMSEVDSGCIDIPAWLTNGNNKVAPRATNFTQREYDYDQLEKEWLDTNENICF